MAKFFRAFFRCPDHEMSNLTIDLFVGDDRLVVRKVATAGWWGRLDSASVWPCVLRDGKRLDFGQSDETHGEEERYATFDLTDQEIIVGETFSMFYCEPPWMEFRLEKLTRIEDLV